MPLDKFDLNDFKYISEKEMPLLVLGIDIHRDYPRKYNPKYKFKFKKIAHQTSGHACNQHYIFGLTIDPKPSVKKSMVEISEDWLDSDAGVFGVSLTEILRYREQLNSKLKVDCNRDYKDFEEGIYPIDYSRETLIRISSSVGNIPENPDDMIKWDSGLGRIAGSIGRWQIFILGPNCD